MVNTVPERRMSGNACAGGPLAAVWRGRTGKEHHRQLPRSVGHSGWQTYAAWTWPPCQGHWQEGEAHSQGHATSGGESIHTIHNLIVQVSWQAEIKKKLNIKNKKMTLCSMKKIVA